MLCRAVQLANSLVGHVWFTRKERSDDLGSKNCAQSRNQELAPHVRELCGAHEAKHAQDRGRLGCCLATTVADTGG